jgi:hypothetical protein
VIWATLIHPLKEAEAFPYLTSICKNIDIEKTKIVKFGKSGRLCETNFKIEEKDIENVQRYKYLGVVLTSSGTFTCKK